MDMLDYAFVICMSAALIFSVIQLCITFYERGYNTGYYVGINSKKKKTSRKR